MTSLGMAIKKGNKEIEAALVNDGATYPDEGHIKSKEETRNESFVDARLHNSQTALIQAVKNKQSKLEMIKILLSARVDPNIVDRNSVFTYAISSGNQKTVEFLLSR